MNVKLKEDKFHIRAFFTPCSCKCRFCCLGDYSKKKQITFEDYEKVLRKCAAVSTEYGMRLRSFIYNCPEHPYLKRQIALYNSLPMEPSEYTQLDLNGTRVKSKEEISEWFDELQSAGVEKVAFSWFGEEETHDAFVNRNGYFAYLNQCALEAYRRNIPIVSKVFLHKGILKELDEVIKHLATFSSTIVCAFMEYSGNAKRMMDDFITIDDYDSISSKAKNYFNKEYLDKFKTENEWIRLAKIGDFPRFNIVDYVLYIDRDNLQQVLDGSISDIVEGFRKKNIEFQNSFGEISELAEQYGDDKSQILYECRDILRKWLDIYFEKNGLDTSQLFSFTHNCVEWKVYERL